MLRSKQIKIRHVIGEELSPTPVSHNSEHTPPPLSACTQQQEVCIPSLAAVAGRNPIPNPTNPNPLPPALVPVFSLPLFPGLFLFERLCAALISQIFSHTFSPIFPLIGHLGIPLPQNGQKSSLQSHAESQARFHLRWPR